MGVNTNVFVVYLPSIKESLSTALDGNNVVKYTIDEHEEFKLKTWMHRPFKTFVFKLMFSYQHNFLGFEIKNVCCYLLFFWIESGRWNYFENNWIFNLII